jgi:hypothetical protein
MRVVWRSLPGGLTAALTLVIVLAGCGQASGPSPDPTSGERHCGTVDVRGASAYPAAGTSMDAEGCLVTALHACVHGTTLVVFDMGVDTSDTTTYSVDPASCHLSVSSSFFSANFGGKTTTTTYACTSASVDAGGLHITGCTSANGSTVNVPALRPAPTPFPTPSL